MNFYNHWPHYSLINSMIDRLINSYDIIADFVRTLTTIQRLFARFAAKLIKNSKRFHIKIVENLLPTKTRLK